MILKGVIRHFYSKCNYSTKCWCILTVLIQVFRHVLVLSPCVPHYTVCVLFLTTVPAMSNCTGVTHTLSSLHLQTIEVEEVCVHWYSHMNTNTHTKKAYLFPTTQTNVSEINSCDLVFFSISAHATVPNCSRFTHIPNVQTPYFTEVVGGHLAWYRMAQFWLSMSIGPERLPETTE